MKLQINGKQIEINAEQLTAINLAIADAPVIAETYNQATKEYEYKAGKNRMQIKAVETLENSVSLAE